MSTRPKKTVIEVQEGKETIVFSLEESGVNNTFSIDDLPLSYTQKTKVLEWFARKVWVMTEEGSGDPDYYCKTYDPLLIENETTAMSYVFGLGDGGRSHTFESLKDLEDRLTKEGIERIKDIGYVHEEQYDGNKD